MVGRDPHRHFRPGFHRRGLYRETLGRFPDDEPAVLLDSSDYESPSPGPPITQSTIAGRTPDEPRIRCPGIAGPAAPKQRDCRQIIHFRSYGEIPSEKHLPENQRNQPPGGCRKGKGSRVFLNWRSLSAIDPDYFWSESQVGLLFVSGKV